MYNTARHSTAEIITRKDLFFGVTSPQVKQFGVDERTKD